MVGRLSVRLHDILDNITIIENAVSQKTFDQFLADPILRLAVERGIEIISEATRHIPAAATDLYPAIPWRNIKAIGNVLRHDYQRIDPDIVWKIATIQLKELAPVVRGILAETGSPS